MRFPAQLLTFVCVIFCGYAGLFVDWIRVYKAGSGKKPTAETAGEVMLTFRFVDNADAAVAAGSGSSTTTLSNGVSQFEGPSGHLHIKVLAGSLQTTDKKARFVDVSCPSSAWHAATATLDNVGDKPEWKQGFVVPVNWQPESAEVPTVVFRVMHSGMLGNSCDGTVVLDVPPFVMCPRQVCRCVCHCVCP